MVKIGIIGGSGLDNPDILKDVKEIKVKTPYGKPTSDLKIGKIHDVEVVLIARHGREHTIPPTQVNYRANIQALKDQGCTHILETTACGSLREEIDRGELPNDLELIGSIVQDICYNNAKNYFDIDLVWY